ncbi:MAG: hypothetical protein K2L34_11375 [Muribaculaceae bacterium]|nr:hypothetical protein [Muribaculaceae bacterium]
MKEEDQVKELCKKVEEVAGIQAVKSKDFEHLVVRIYERTGTLLSPTTLKRIWGYLKEPTVTRRSTLDLLAQFCGWHTYDEFLKGSMPEIESSYLSVKVLNAERDLSKGDVVKLMWHPSRVCEIEYLGNNRWTVVTSEGTRLLPGDTFRCSMIMTGEPLYLDDVVHDGVHSGIYVCGRRHGVRFTVADRLASPSLPN